MLLSHHIPLMVYIAIGLTICSIIATCIFIILRHKYNEHHTSKDMSYTTLWKYIQTYPTIDIDYLKYIEETGTFSVLQPRSSRRRMLRDGIIFFQGKTPRIQPLLAPKIATVNRTNPTQLYL